MSSEKSGFSQQPPPSYSATAGYGQPAGYQTSVVVTQPVHSSTPHNFRPPDYLVLSIIACFFCWPMALCAISSSISSRGAADVGDMTKAECDGRSARNISIGAILFGLVIVVVVVALKLTIWSSYCYGYYNC